MNAFYVTVSIPILLVLAGFNNAHGLTTFGKSNGQGQNTAHTVVQGKHCTSQENCTFKGTTCLKSFCLCGDNTNPQNGQCHAAFKGPGHICQKDEECVEGALCQDPDEKTKGLNAPIAALHKTCQCLENLTPMPGGTCSDGTHFLAMPGLLLVVMVLGSIY